MTTCAPALAAPPTHAGADPPLTAAERAAVAMVVAGAAVAAVAGTVAARPGTIQYVLVVLALAVLVARVRRRPLPAPLAISLGLLSWSHLAGGLVPVGDSVLYNADPGTPLLQYDHIGHFAGILLGTLAVWELCVAGRATVPTPALVVATTLAGLGLGAVNEAVEFVATLVQDGSHVGGYANTGWDLVTNSIAGAVAGWWLSAPRARC